MGGKVIGHGNFEQMTFIVWQMHTDADRNVSNHSSRDWICDGGVFSVGAPPPGCGVLEKLPIAAALTKHLGGINWLLGLDQ